MEEDLALLGTCLATKSQITRSRITAWAKQQASDGATNNAKKKAANDGTQSRREFFRRAKELAYSDIQGLWAANADVTRHRIKAILTSKIGKTAGPGFVTRVRYFVASLILQRWLSRFVRSSFYNFGFRAGVHFLGF